LTDKLVNISTNAFNGIKFGLSNRFHLELRLYIMDFEKTFKHEPVADFKNQLIVNYIAVKRRVSRNLSVAFP